MSTHRCPAPGCDVQVADHRLACPWHWFSIPKQLRDDLWRAYKTFGALSKQHLAAVQACVAHLRAAEAA